LNDVRFELFHLTMYRSVDITHTSLAAFEIRLAMQHGVQVALTQVGTHGPGAK